MSACTRGTVEPPLCNSTRPGSRALSIRRTKARRDRRAKSSGDVGVQTQHPGVLLHNSQFVMVPSSVVALNEDPEMLCAVSIGAKERRHGRDGRGVRPFRRRRPEAYSGYVRGDATNTTTVHFRGPCIFARARGGGG